VSTGDTAVKKTTLVFFINGRPTDCPALKAALDSAYAALHSKAATYWAFVDARVPAAHVDVNIHPTKSEVALLFQPELAEAVRSAVEEVLSTCHDVRSFARPRTAAVGPMPGAPSHSPRCSNFVCSQTALQGSAVSVHPSSELYEQFLRVADPH
jgi:DNA mismatch repair ATPase MutL